MTIIKPPLACDWIEAKVKFPCFAQPKVDGVRGGHYGTGSFTGRSLKQFKNRALTTYWSDPAYHGIDGELVLPGKEWTSIGMCRLTTGLTNRPFDPTVPDLISFDMIDRHTLDLPYWKRRELLEKFARRLKDPKLHVMPNEEVRNMAALLALEERWMKEGYEGVIIRLPGAKVKQGRSGLGMECWRIKRFIDFEFIIDELIEAQENTNEAKRDALGHIERSSAKAGKVGKGMVGMLRGRIVKDVVHNGKVLFPKGFVVDVGPGEMPHIERIHYWAKKHRILGKIGKAKTFPHDVLVKPRMPTFTSLRSKEDMS